MKCILLKSREFPRDEFFIFFSKDLIKQLLYSVGFLFFSQIFVFDDIFNVRKIPIFFRGEKIQKHFKMYIQIYLHFIIIIFGQIDLQHHHT